MPRSIIVSDLHVDTWTDDLYGEGARKKTKLDHWSDFLNWCEEKQIDELVINGDLMDAPPYEGDSCFASEITRRAVQRLGAYAVKRKVTYVYGNHDIGMSGLRCDSAAPLGLANVRLVYPNHCVQHGSTVLIQHGHLFDPALCLYIRDLTERTYLLSEGQALYWVQQRRDLATGDQRQTLGVISPGEIDLAAQAAETVYEAILNLESAAPPSTRDMQTARRWIQELEAWSQPSRPLRVPRAVAAVYDWVKGLFRPAFPRIAGVAARVIWRAAAEAVFQKQVAQQPGATGRIYCVMGHTHLPDRMAAEVAGRECRYLNSGTWTESGETPEDRQSATYLDVRETGKVWVQDWISDPYVGA